LGRLHEFTRWRKRPGIRRACSRAMAISLFASLALISAGDLPAQVAASELHADCLFCHLTDSQTDGSLILPEPRVCQLCHIPHNDHAILTRPTTVEPSLPLTDGLMTCVTCHDPHSPEPLQLRLPATRLCLACHNR
jgi:predicted CXXCH cytochrome family protein